MRKKAGISGRIHSTLLRKGAVNAVHKNHKEATSNLADLMAHKEGTAVKYYHLTEKAHKKASVKASQTLHAMMRKKSSTLSSEVSKELQQQPGDEVVEEHTSSCPSNVPWSIEAMQEIRKLFEEEIHRNKVTMACMKERIKGSDIHQSESPRRVNYRVRTEWKNPAAQINAPASLPTKKEDVSDRVNRLSSDDIPSSRNIIPLTTPSHATKALFSEEQVQLLHHLFQDMLKKSPITKKVTDAQGEEMLQTLLLPQIVNHIKYERRQKREKQTKLTSI